MTYEDYDSETWRRLGEWLRQRAQPNELMVETLLRLMREAAVLLDVTPP